MAYIFLGTERRSFPHTAAVCCPAQITHPGDRQLEDELELDVGTGIKSEFSVLSL